MMRRFWERVTRDWTLKLASLGVAVLLWSIVKSEELTSVTINNVPVAVRVRDPGWELASAPSPSRVSLVFTGPLREVVRLAVESPRVVVPVEEVQDSVEVTVLRSNWVELEGSFPRTQVSDIRPSTARLVFDRVDVRLIPLKLPVTGALPPGEVLTGAVQLDPAFVRASGPRRRLTHVDSIPLAAIDLSRITDTTSVRVDVDTAGLGLVIAPTRVRVTIPVAPAAPPDSLPALPTGIPSFFSRPR